MPRGRLLSPCESAFLIVVNQTRRFFAALCGRNQHARLCYQGRCCFRPHNTAVHIMTERVRGGPFPRERWAGPGRRGRVPFDEAPDRVTAEGLPARSGKDGIGALAAAFG